MNKKELVRIAKKRINYLFNIDDEDIKDILPQAIRDIRTKYNVRLNKSQKQRFCKKCMSFYKYPKIRFKRKKKGGDKYIQKRIICDRCGYESRYSI